jgi:hypothetical protein
MTDGEGMTPSGRRTTGDGMSRGQGQRGRGQAERRRQGQRGRGQASRRGGIETGEDTRTSPVVTGTSTAIGF